MIALSPVTGLRISPHAIHDHTSFQHIPLSAAQHPPLSVPPAISHPYITMSAKITKVALAGVRHSFQRAADVQNEN
jgi:hypothetical protein